MLNRSFILFLSLGLVTILSSFYGGGDLPAKKNGKVTGNPSSGKDPMKSGSNRFREITQSQLIHLIDSILDKENVDFRDVELLNQLTEVLKDKHQILIESPFKELKNIHFYSDEEEKLLFPPYPLDSLPAEFTILLEDPRNQNYANPFNGVLTSYYGWRDKRMHKGIDIDLNKGEPVAAAFDGKVRVAKKNSGGFGNVVIIMHPNGLETVYAHLSKIKVKPGQVVLSGQTIGLGGNTGRSHGSHLHFETRYKGYAINPLNFIAYEENKLKHFSLTFTKSKKNLVAYPTNAFIHKVSKGEGWTLLAKKYNTSVKKLLALNGSIKRYYIPSGTLLRVR